MVVKIFPLGLLTVNTLFVYDPESKEGMIVDPAGELDEIVGVADRNDVKVNYIVNTHEHPDHVAKNAWAKIEFSDAELLMHPAAAESINRWIESDFGRSIGAEYSPPPDRTINDGDVLEIGKYKFKVFHTPGHSPGSISLFNEDDNFVIVGDLIFKGSIGRYDLPGSDYETLKKSIVRLLDKLNKDTVIIPGHGPTTTVKQELLDNPFIREFII
ncbi:MBL fold metallo-hydrolase [Desulfurobacterium indicum]|uniref:MBL fold metallo-hydrolase n=1 Tax=Desulfurobacterium indicum TaxID=1914305 RepID=A0A1R1MLD6_9BACT|nr:MBL fold metallo-hydrolase [Desulfurobacterium indicum]OMH40569.1 MBL fold metallo-hydrolase [Desulfurobacterium indicum]